MNSVFKALTGVVLGFCVLSSIAAVNRLVKHPALEIEDYLEVVGDPAKTNRIGGAGTIFSNWIALSGTPNKLTDDGQQLLRNGLPIGGFTTNTFNVIITTNIQVVSILEVNNSFFTNVTVYEIITIATNITIDQHITLKQNSTLIFTNNTYVTTNTFLFVNSTGAVVSAELNAGDGISITAGTNISTKIEAGSGITVTTNAGTVVIADTSDPVGANPTGTVGLSAVNGAAATFLRSDGAPALSQAIAPQWTDIHKYEKNVGAVLSVGDTTFADVQRASQTNQISGALTIAHATNGVDGVDMTHVRWFFNGSGSDQTLTIPSGWRTNVYSAVPPALTNGTITRMVLACGGPTADAASQTNCYVSFEYFK